MEPTFDTIDADLRPTEIESLCMNCEENGLTRLLLTRIPHFKEVILMAFECPHCGCKNNEIQSGSAIAEQGMQQTLIIQNVKDLSRQIVKAETASIHFVELDFEIPSTTQRGVLSTVEGIISRAIDGLSQEQEKRKTNDPDLYKNIEAVIARLKLYNAGEQFPFTLVLDDPAGNSYIENVCAPKPDPQITLKHYKRTEEQDVFLGLTLPVDTDENLAQENNNQTPADGGLGQDDLAFKEEVHVFPGNCSRCHVPCETKMHLLGRF